MIFSCGETPEVEEKRRGEWRPFFALWPRTIDSVDGKYRCVWLQWIEIREAWCGSWGGSGWAAHYRLKGDE